MRIADSVAVVTGASAGIGEEVAVDLARRGATVVVAARRVELLERVAERCRAHAPSSFAVAADVASGDDCRRLVATVTDRCGRVDLLVNNAGVSLHRHALETSAADVERVMRVNFLGAVELTTLVLPGMVERRRGSIVNITSVAGYIPNPHESAYGASKAALSLWSHGLSVDLHGTGVHVGVLSPGPIDTEIWDKDEGPRLYHGPKFPPSTVAAGLARMVEHGLTHLTVPRRYGAVPVMYALPGLGRAVRFGLVRYERKGRPATG